MYFEHIPIIDTNCFPLAIAIPGQDMHYLLRNGDDHVSFRKVIFPQKLLAKR